MCSALNLAFVFALSHTHKRIRKEIENSALLIKIAYLFFTFLQNVSSIIQSNKYISSFKIKLILYIFKYIKFNDLNYGINCNDMYKLQNMNKERCK